MRTRSLLLAASLATALSGCYGGVYIGIGDDAQAPSVALNVTPAQVTTPGTINLSASVTAERPVVQVQFFERTAAGTVLLATDVDSPFEIDVTVSASDNGTLQFFATATDTGGLSGQSATVQVPVAIP
ncbi:MAG TPA: Ig-like domain-containing protein [Burkholderiaceae bacterium]|nr:Ig-like domain-containing protein [Burkholderiaceae bacterium]